MKINTFKKNLTNLFSENKIKAVLKILKKELNENTDSYMEYIQIRRRYNALSDQQMAALIADEAAMTELNKIGAAILQFIQKMKAEDLKNNMVASLSQIANPILLITNDAQKLSSLKNFMEQLNFSSVKVTHSSDIPEEGSYDLVIIDNRHFPACPNEKILSQMAPEPQKEIRQSLELMDKLIRNTSLFIIHFGEYLYWINQHRERIHAANSQFSLYARTKEMLDFINTYRV